MELDHDAIMLAYKDTISYVDDDTGVWGKDGKQITPDQTLVDAARTELAKEDYKWQRAEEYPDWGTQLDYIYHNGLDKWKTDIVDPVKTKYPKP